MKRRIRYSVSILLVFAMLLTLLPVSALAKEPEEPTSTGGAVTTETETPDPSESTETPETTPTGRMIYVSANVNGTQDGTKEHPYDSLKDAVDAAPANKATIIYVMSNLTMTDSARFWDGKDITITSDPESLPENQTAFTISRAETGFNAVQDDARGGYNPAMIEVGNGADLTMTNLILDDGGFAAYTDPSAPGSGTVSDGTPYFTQVDASRGGNPKDQPQPGSTMVGETDVSNHEIVQDAIIASYDSNSTITLGSGAVLENFGGMSAVRVTGSSKLKMLYGSKICDTIEDFTRSKGAAGSLGPTGAVWVQDGTFTMEKGAEISGINGRAVYADQGTVTIAGTISNLTYNANFQNAFQGLAVHLRGGASGEVSGQINDITSTAANSSILHAVDKGTLVISGKIFDITSPRIINIEGNPDIGENAPDIRTKLVVSGEIYRITTSGYVLYLSEAAVGTLSGYIHNIAGSIVYLVDGSGEDYVGDTYPTEFTMENGAVIDGVQNGSIVLASVSRDSLTAPHRKVIKDSQGNIIEITMDRPIEKDKRDHVSFVIDGEIKNTTLSNMFQMNADIDSVNGSDYAKTPGEYIDCTIGPNAKIHDNTANRIIWTQGGTVNIYGKMFDNTACVYKGFNNCGDAVVTLYEGMEIYGNDSSSFHAGDWGGDCVIGASSAIVTMKGGSIHDNISSGSASAIYIGTGGKFIMEGGEIYNNNNTSGTGGQISFCSGTTWPGVVDSSVEFKGGKIYDNTATNGYDMVITPSDAGSFTGTDNGRERCFTVPSPEITNDIGIYYQQATHQDSSTKETVVDYYGKSMTVDPGTKLGVVSKDDTKNSLTGSLTTLKNAATSYGLAAPFTTFWAYSEAGTPVSIKMDAAQEGQSAPAFDSSKPVYVLIQKTDETGYPASGVSVSLQAATVDADGTIRFNLTTEATGAAIALAQPADATGALTISTDVTELNEGNTPYEVPYTVKFDLDELDEDDTSISASAIQSAEVTFYSTNGDWNAHEITLSTEALTGSWTATLDPNDFQANGVITTSAVLTITTATDTYTFYSNAVTTQMISGAITITPAKITVYTGGEGYTGVVDNTGKNTTAKNGLPEPGFYITLPKSLNDQLGGNTNAEDLSSILTLTYDDGKGTTREWKLEPYGTSAHSTDVAGVTTARYIYRILPSGQGTENEIPVRLQLKDGNTVITSDQFTPDSTHQYKSYEMSIYTKGLTAEDITAKITIGGQTYSCAVNGTSGELVVRGLTADNTTTEIETEEENVSGDISAVAPAGITYYVNGSNVALDENDVAGVKLLVDDVLDNGVLSNYIQNNMTDLIQPGNYTYAQKYLDLVDTKNGNAYLTIDDDKEMDVYWQVPSNMNTDKNFYVVHFNALDRNYDNIQQELRENPPAMVAANLVTIGEKQYIHFATGSFSPFVLVYEQKSTGGGVATYTIDASVGEGGTIDPSGKVSVTSGSSKSFTITADEGYKIADVLVDGESVGAVGTYTFEKVNTNHTISASFEKEITVADPDDTGVSGLLNTKDHFAYLQGMPNDLFCPGQDITRAEVAQMFYNLLLNKDVSSTVAFTDVAEDAWYADAVNTLASMGILKGVGGGRFEPTRNITRAEFTVIAMRFGKLDTTGTNIFSDVSESDWFYNEVVGSIQYGWIQGFTDGTFRPYLQISRAEVTVITNRMLGRSADRSYVDAHSDELRQFTDVDTDNWAYYDIAEATNNHNYVKTAGGETWSK